MTDIADTLIRSYERDLKAGVAVGMVKRHANHRVRALRKAGNIPVALKLDTWINSNL